MSLEQAWHKIGEQPDDDLAALLRAKELPKMASKSPLMILKKKMLRGMVGVIMINIAYVFVIVYYFTWPVFITLSLVFAFNAWYFYTSFKIYKQLETNASATNPVLIELKRQHQAFIDWLRISRLMAIPFYFISTFGGYVLSLSRLSLSAEILFDEPIVILKLTGIAIIISVISHFMAIMLQKIFYQKQLNNLKRIIDEMESGC